MTWNARSETEKILKETASTFFGDLNRILIEYLLLQVCKVTDPPADGGRENLTVAHMNVVLHRSGLITKEIIEYSEKLRNYRDLVKGARNRLVSHLDKASVMKGEALGEHRASDVLDFLLNLQRYLDAVGEVIDVGPLDISGSAAHGDAIDLIKALK